MGNYQSPDESCKPYKMPSTLKIEASKKQLKTAVAEISLSAKKMIEKKEREMLLKIDEIFDHIDDNAQTSSSHTDDDASDTKTDDNSNAGPGSPTTDGNMNTGTRPQPQQQTPQTVIYANLLTNLQIEMQDTLLQLFVNEEMLAYSMSKTVQLPIIRHTRSTSISHDSFVLEWENVVFSRPMLRLAGIMHGVKLYAQEYQVCYRISPDTDTDTDTDTNANVHYKNGNWKTVSVELPRKQSHAWRKTGEWKKHELWKVPNLTSATTYECKMRYEISKTLHSPYSWPVLIVKTKESPPKEYEMNRPKNIELLIAGFISGCIHKHQNSLWFNKTRTVVNTTVEEKAITADANTNTNANANKKSNESDGDGGTIHVPAEIYRMVKHFYHQLFVLEWSDVYIGKHMTLSDKNLKVSFSHARNGHSVRALMGVKKGSILAMRFTIYLTGKTLYAGNFFGVCSSKCKKFNTIPYKSAEVISNRKPLVDAFGIDAAYNRIYKGNQKRDLKTLFWTKEQFKLKENLKLKMICDYKTNPNCARLTFKMGSAAVMGSSKNTKKGYTMKLPEVTENMCWYPVCSLVNDRSWCKIQYLEKESAI